MVSKEDLEELYRLRGLATDKEREIEDRIFQPAAYHTALEVEELITQYRKAKKARASASIDAAKAFMLATPEVRKAAEWRKFTPGHEDDEGRGANPIVERAHGEPTRDTRISTAFRGGLQKLMLDIAILQTEDKRNVRIVIPQDKFWVVINPHATLERFCDNFQDCDVVVKCCAQQHVCETPEQLQVRNNWKTTKRIRVRRDTMMKLIHAASWACADAHESMRVIAFSTRRT